MIVKNMKRYILLFGGIVFSCFGLYAQDQRNEDSLWVSRMLEGKDTIRINPEYLKAMQEGTLISTPEVEKLQLKHAPSELSIIKDFTEYLKLDSGQRRLDYKSLPPAVFRMYMLDTVPGTGINSAAYTSRGSLVVKDQIQIGKLPVRLSLGAQNLYSSCVKDGQRRGTLGTSVVVVFSAEDMLRYVFWKSERYKRKNRKREFTWKHYNSFP